MDHAVKAVIAAAKTLISAIIAGGYIEAGVISKFSLCSVGMEWFKSRGQFIDGSYVPTFGDLIFFDWGNDGSIDYVGIVEREVDETVYTNIEKYYYKVQLGRESYYAFHQYKMIGYRYLPDKNIPFKIYSKSSDIKRKGR